MNHKAERRPNAGEHRGGGRSVAANHSTVLYHTVHIRRTPAARLTVNIEAICTLLACLWRDADHLSQQHIDAEHLALAVNTDLAARLAHRLYAQLAEALEGRAA